jgi:hypothetical protein
MLRYDGVYLHETEDGEILCLRFYPPPDIYGTPDPPPGTVIGMETIPVRLDSDLRWLGMGNANRFALSCTTAYVSLMRDTIEFVLIRDTGYSWGYGGSRRFKGTVRENSLDLETHKWNESFETCPHILCYFEFRPLPPDFEQENAPADDPNTDVCVRCNVRAFKDTCLKETIEGYMCRACDRESD